MTKFNEYPVLTATPSDEDTFLVYDYSAGSVKQVSQSNVTYAPLKADKVTSAIAGNLAELDASGNLVDSGIAAGLSTSSAYGVRYDYSTDTFQRGVSIGGVFVPCEVSTFPIQEQMKRGLLTTAGVFTPLNPDDSSKVWDGTSDATIDGSEGQVMVQIPKFHVVAKRDGDYRYLLISQDAFVFDGTPSWVPGAFLDDDYRYIGAFLGVAKTDALDADLISAVKDTSGYVTNPNPNPFSNRTRTQFRAQQESGFFQYSWGLYEVVWMLYLTEYANWNTQEELPGYTEASSWDYTYTRPAGRTLSLGNASGSILVDLTGEDSDLDGIVAADGYVANSYRGIENVFGNVWQFLDGINIDNTTGDCHVYISNEPGNFTDATATNYIDTGHAPGFGDDDNYAKDMAWLGENLTFYPATIGDGASSSTYITDYHYNGADGWRAMRVGNEISSGAVAGLGCLYAVYTSAYVSGRVSARSAA
jgi:hypothetical protein